MNYQTRFLQQTIVDNSTKIGPRGIRTYHLYSLLLSRRTQAEQADISIRSNGCCQSLDIPVTVTAATAIYDIPPIGNDQGATAWAIWDADRTNLHNYQTIVQNTTTSDTFNIHGKVCVSKTSSSKADILQFATHGIAFDPRYWNVDLQSETHSYVKAVLQAGYSIFTHDRLGTGQSDKPNAYTVIQGPVELEVMRQLTLMARSGALYSMAVTANNSTVLLDQPSYSVWLRHAKVDFSS